MNFKGGKRDTLGRRRIRRGLLLAGAFVLGGGSANSDPVATTRYPAYELEPEAAEQVVSVSQTGRPGSRVFVLRSDAPQREGAASERRVREVDGDPFVTTGNSTFDALFSMAIDDARRDSVEEIRDDSYNSGKPIPCHCFETGEKWHYVWTRDLAYALDLGLAGIDPDRAVSSLLFKTGSFRAGVPIPAGVPSEALQVVQDTGSGGSWPVSTDRVVWAVGAERVLANLDGAARKEFAAKAYAALRGTVEADRLAAFDPRDGLYGGEHSFLDWREQTYAPWIVDDLAAMAQSKALSTNILELRALRLAARLAGETGDGPTAARYSGWADALRRAINKTFWNEAKGLYATYTTADQFAAPIEKFDLLGNALAILSDVADQDRSRNILSSYPFAPFGPPVVWPQQPDQFVYHNRAQWPFVTAYALVAAARTGHVAAADRSLASLIRAAALHLSNYENLEWLTGRSAFDDGPAINSPRQLWSVGGYIGSVVGVVFGWQPEAEGVQIKPFLTSETRRMFADAGEVTLSGLRFRGHTVSITLKLPKAERSGGLHSVQRVKLNGATVEGPISPSMLATGSNRIEVEFQAAAFGTDATTQAPTISPLSHDDPRAFMPKTPDTPVVERTGNNVSVSFPSIQSGLTYSVWRNGRRIAADLSSPRWSDPNPLPGDLSVCYSVRVRHVAAGLESQPSVANCGRGRLAQTIAANDARVTGTANLPRPDKAATPMRRLALNTSLSVGDVVITQPGTYAVALRYDNHVHALNTGVTNAVKRLVITGPGGHVLERVVQMPHVRPVEGKNPLRLSTRAYVRLEPGKYRLRLDDFFNMSALSTNQAYSGPGGGKGPINEANVAAILVDAVE